jgi:hypothetical protein
MRGPDLFPKTNFKNKKSIYKYKKHSSEETFFQTEFLLPTSFFD